MFFVIIFRDFCLYFFITVLLLIAQKKRERIIILENIKATY